MSHADSICVGQSATFSYTGNMNSSSYTWQFPFGSPSTVTGIGPHTVTYNTPGCHPVILILNNEMQGTIDCVDSICVFPNPVATLVQVNNSLQANPSGLSYQWYSQNPNWTILPGETNQFLNPTNGGLYSVVVTNEFGCSDTASIDFVGIGIDEFEMQNWNIFPNPNDGSYTLDFSSTTNETIKMSLYTAFGDLVELRTMNVHPGSQSFFISNQNISPGVYYIEIATENARGIKKLVVK